MKDFTILIKFPSRERPEKFFAVLNRSQKLRGLTTTKYMITLDSNDPTMNNDRVKRTMNLWGNLTYHYGESKNKIDAINRDMDKARDWDIILLLSDDMMPIEQNYDKIISDTMQKHFPDLDGVLWLNDGHTHKRLNTIVCMGRKYFERFNFIYEPTYKSLFADNEFTDISVKLQKVFYIEQVLIQHRHPMNVGGASDNLYRRNDAHFYTDRKLYFYRKENVLA